MGELKVTPEGMPAIHVGGTKYPLFFSVYGLQRWAEYRGCDFQEGVEKGWAADELSQADLAKLLEIALESGDARRVAFAGGEPREVTEKTLGQVFAVYSLAEVALVLAEAWNLLPEGESSPNPEAPHE